MTATSPNDREKKRERERRARQRRAANIERMRQTLKGLEGSVLAVRTLDDEVWGRFLNANAMHVRRMLLLAKEANALVLEEAQLQRLLREHQLSTSCIEAMLKDGSVSRWQRDIEKWRELTRRHYKPWSIDDCQEVIDAALREINAFYWSTDKQSSGLSFLGWCDLRRVDAVRGVFQFQFHKIFRGFDMMDYVNVGWDVFTDARTFKEVLIGPHLMGSHEILQQLTPNMMITRNTERFPSVAGNIHILYLVFRVKTEKGFTQCMRSIHSPDLMRAIGGPNDVWASNFSWLQWEELEDEQHARAYKFRIGGSLRGMDLSHMNQWMLELFGVVLRSERLATGRQLLTNESSERARPF